MAAFAACLAPVSDASESDAAWLGRKPLTRSTVLLHYGLCIHGVKIEGLTIMSIYELLLLLLMFGLPVVFVIWLVNTLNGIRKDVRAAREQQEKTD